MIKRIGLASLALLGIGLYRYRRSLLALVLRLPPPRYKVRVERGIPIAMPDGIRLLTDHYSPLASPTANRDTARFPTILIRTPYGRGKEVALGGGYALSELPAQRFAERGYHVVIQGARGCFDSEGEFSPHINEAEDGKATVDWICRQSWFNGSLGTWGPSYLGYTQWATAAALPEALSAMVVMITSADNYSVSHPDGAFGLETRLRWSQGIHVQKALHRRPFREQVAQRFFSGEQEQRLQAAFSHLPLLEADTAAAGEPVPFYREIVSNDQPDDAYWTARDHREAVGQVAAPVHLIGGWYDYYLRGLLRDYETLKAAERKPRLTIGPWHHAHAGGLLAGLREGLAWFDEHLKGRLPESGAEDGDPKDQKPVRIYVMGAETWRELDDFPPETRKTRYYLHPASRLGTEPPPAESDPDRYRYDPADPTPALGGALLALRGAGPQDNRPLEARPDVLCYTSAPLEQDLEVIGPVRLELYARSSQPHTDFYGRLCDVAPNGRSTNICDGLLRLHPSQPGGKPTTASGHCLRLEIDLWATAHRFRQGHCLRLLVSSGAHPRWSRNLGTGEPDATGASMVFAEQMIFHDEARPSALVLPVVSALSNC
jgi:putative CocE/NonD family hydrolase